MEKIAVLGSNSFSGSHFVAYALSHGLDVLGISRSAEPIKEFLPYQWAKHEGAFRFEQLDMNVDATKLAETLKAYRPDYIVNFAAQGMVAESWQHPEHWYQTNVVANVLLHDQLRRFDFLKKYVHVSTPEVYGSCSGLVPEEAPFNPSTPYAASRAACELHLRTFLKNYNFPVTFTRSANVYGPGQQLYRIIPRTILYILLGKKLQLHGGGRSVRSFIHIRDVADGTLRVAREGTPGEAYHFSTTLNISIREVVEKICTLMGAAFEKVAEVVGDRPGKDAAYLLDNAKARRTLHWEPKVELEPGIQETIAWVRGNLDALSKEPLDYIHKP
ncbi:MAG TPA: GDP-mannose 4,6-dehydratase [Chthoniobacteraceae bacterium]|nr:GDP-mannose 4,6-dehydratase [Chthoniobacteraceae bacterium]